MEMLFFGVNLLVGYAMWRYMWRKTALDKYRDQLFDLRDEVKEFFIERKYGVDHHFYSELRGLINGHIRYTERLTLRLFIAQTAAMSAHPEFARTLKEQADNRFATEDVELAKFIKDVRTRSVAILTGHMAETSFGFLVLFPFMYCVVAIIKTFSSIKAFAIDHNEKLISGIRATLKFAPIAGFMFAIPARAGIVDKAFDADIVEEYSIQATYS